MSERDERDSLALAAARLRRPVRELTRLGVDEWTVRRMWEGIQRRSTGRAAGTRRSLGRIICPPMVWSQADIIGSTRIFVDLTANVVRSRLVLPLVLPGDFGRSQERSNRS